MTVTTIVRRTVACTLGLVIGFGSAAVVDRADGSPEPAQNTCNEQENPCYTVDQMTTYFRQRSHGFLYLSHKYTFPATFIHMAQAARAAYCEKHPVICRHTMKMLYDFNHPGKGKALPPGADETCGRYAWWCNERGYISCAGGSLQPYWSCPGAFAQQEGDMDRELSHADKIIIIGGVTIITEVAFAGAPLAVVAIGRGGYAMFDTWLGFS